MERTVSETGSVRSSPSTRTVYNPVMLPLDEVFPALSRSLGIFAKQEGVYPFVVGGSPTARPISRMDMAKRVMESIMRSTSRP
jgi:hypothetical protein